MHNWIKGTLIFVGGFASGVAASYLAARHFLDLQWVESEESIDEEPTEEKEDDVKKETNIPANKSADAIAEKYPELEENESYIDYNKVKAKLTTQSESDDIYNNVMPEDVDIYGDPKDPYVIDEKTFGEIYDYDETYIKFYANDELLTDDWNYPIDDEIAVIGEEAKAKLLEGDSDVVYVKNDKLKAYYKIAVQHEDYPGISG